ncbi:MAG TPA: C1 family peptidase [Bacteroidia bacterium]|nr:C1 family peptidase [Bacteroidia bacterium]
MKKALHIIALFSLVSWSAFGQNFIRIGQSDAEHQIRIPQDQALELRLPITPSTGFGWYSANNTEGVVKQIGDWEFISDNPANPIGSSGTQVIHYVATAAGTADLELVYKRPWEDVSNATAHYKVTIVSEGVYSGVEVKPYVPTTDPVMDAAALVSNDEKTLGLPASFSWLDQGQMTVCKNQGSCGSCWAFAACGSFESVVKIWDNVTRDMAEQWLVNCTPGMDCGGGMFPGSMFKNYGCVYEPDQPYKATDGTCKSSYTYHEKPKGYQEVSASTAQIKQAIYNYGPIWAAICAGSNFQNYKSGVLTKSDGSQMNHAIVLCGWDDATSSWVLRNSWGTTWGENQGYMRIKWGVSIVGTHPTYFDYRGIIPHVPTNVNDIDVSSASVYPNPSSGLFTFSGLTNENTIEVYDYIGNLVYQNTSKNSSVAVDLMDKSHGIYMYKIINANGVKSGKLMVY